MIWMSMAYFNLKTLTMNNTKKEQILGHLDYGEGIEVPLIQVDRVRDAAGALCLDCAQRFDPTTNPYWHWRKSQVMHERGTRHLTRMFKIGCARERGTESLKEIADE